MDGLRTARVLVLDDKLEEAKPFMEALAKRGIGSIYFSGELETLPTTDDGLTGIRLAVIDLSLDIEGEADEVIGKLRTVLDRLIHKKNGPYLAIVWTTGCNDDYFKEFVRIQQCLNSPPVRLIDMKKGDYADTDSVDSIFEKVREEIEKAYPLSLLSFWEQIIHDSSGAAMEVLPVSANWIGESGRMLRLLLDATATRGESSQAKFTALLSALNAVQLDNIETAALRQQDENAQALLSPLNDIQFPILGEDGHDEYEDMKAALNYRLLCSAPLSGIAPGNIYNCEHIDSGQTKLFPTVGQLAFDAANPDCKDNHRKLRKAGCIPIAMEVSPLCDYQQGGNGFPRFICGLAVPFDQISLLKERALFLRKTQPIAFDTPPLQGKMVLVWNSHYMVSVPRKVLTDAAGLVRLRQAPLIDVQAWLGNQGNRPGYLSIHMFDNQ